MNHVPVIMEVVVVVVVVSVVAAAAAAAAVVVVVVEVIVTDARNQVILHVIVLNLIHVVDKVVAHQINKVGMMMMIEIRYRMAN